MLHSRICHHLSSKIYYLESFSLAKDTQLRFLKVISSKNVRSKNVIYYNYFFFHCFAYAHPDKDIPNYQEKDRELKDKTQKGVLFSAQSLETQYQPQNDITWLRDFFRWLAFTMSKKNSEAGINRSSHRRNSIKKGILKNFANNTKKRLSWSLFQKSFLFCFCAFIYLFIYWII